MKISQNRSAAIGSKTLETADLPTGRRNGQVKKTVRRKVRTPRPIGRRSRPETPLLRWKFEEEREEEEVVVVESEKKCSRRVVKKEMVMVSARRLAAGLWKLQPYVAVGSRDCVEQLGFQVEI